MTIALMQKKIEDLIDYVHTLEHWIDEEHVHHKSLEHDVNVLNRYVTKSKK